MSLTTVLFTPKNITKGLDVIRQMKSLKTIGLSYDGDKDKFPPAEFWKKYDAGEFGKPASPAAPADRKPITTFNDPAFQQWMKEVAALPAERQVEAVVKKLQELNPGFDGKVTAHWGKDTPQIENGVVTGFGFYTDNVTDISPVRALEGLRNLFCGGHDTGNSRLSDLSPLQGMRLTELRCNSTQVSDLSPLKGMPLTNLDCAYAHVSDLSPLKGMPLTGLRCYGTQVSDLSPLKGMPLTFLDCSDTPVSDVSPLKGIPLTQLFCYGTPVTDLSPIEGMNLAMVLFTPKSVTKGLDVIRQMKSLKTIGLRWEDKDKFPAAEFWKKYDAGEFNR